MSDLPPAIVVGLQGVNGLQTARVLASRRIPVIAISGDRRDPSNRTRVCRRIVYADTRSEELIEALVALGPSLEAKGVLVPCYDMPVLLLSRHRAALSQWYHVPLPPEDVIETLTDKVSFYEFAKSRGLPIPETRILRNAEDARIAARELRFPAVLKPARSADPAWEKVSAFKGYRVHNAEELIALHERGRKLSDVLLVQEWVQGPETNLYTCNLYFDTASRPLVTFVTRKIRQWPLTTGEGCLGQEDPNDTILEEALRLFRSVGYTGLGYLEMKRDERTDRLLITEPNIGRPTGMSALAEAAGVELLATMYRDTLGLPLPEQRTQSYRGVKWMHVRRDAQSAFHYWRVGELSLGDWYRSVRGKKTYADVSWSDPMPFLADVWREIGLALDPGRRRVDLRK